MRLKMSCIYDHCNSCITDGEVSWVSVWVSVGVCVGDCFVFSPNDVSGLRRPENVKFGTKEASSTRMMCALGFLGKKDFNCGKIGQKPPMLGQKRFFLFSLARRRYVYRNRNSVYVAPPCE